MYSGNTRHHWDRWKCPVIREVVLLIREVVLLIREVVLLNREVVLYTKATFGSPESVLIIEVSWLFQSIRIGESIIDCMYNVQYL